MQAIQTKYFGPTNHNGARIVARCDAKRITVSWDYSLDVRENHEVAADELRRRLEWSGVWKCGALPDGSFAHVFVRG